jgi:hypothetical protein
MSKVTIERAVLEQAVEALDSAVEVWGAPWVVSASTALREALNAPQPEPVVYMDRDCVEQPSGWRFLHSKAMANENSVPLYTAPPQPLSLDQISMIFNSVYPAQPLSQNIINLVQEVEKHHGIK